MENLTLSQSIIGILSIVLMDLMLGGDNAIVIGMACRNLDPKLRKKGVIIGTLGAVAIRIVATVVVVWLLRINYLRLVGGLLLLFIGYKLAAKNEDAAENVKAKDTLLKAILTIIAADFLMGIDNVLAVAGAAHDSFALVIFGLCLSVPIMVAGSALIIKLLDRFPVIVYVGAGVIFYTGAHMVTLDPKTAPFFEARGTVFTYVFLAAVVAAGLALSYCMKKRSLARKR